MADNLPQVGAEAVLIHDEYDRDIADVIKLADKADKALNDIDGTVDVKVNVDDGDIGSTLLQLDDLSEDASLKVNVDDAELATANKIVDDIDNAAPDVKVNVDDKEVKNTDSILTSIRNIGIIDLAFNVSDKVQGLFETLGRFSGVGGVVELDNALASIQGRTGRMIPDAEKLITDLYTNGWGESRTAIADTIVEATNLKIAQDDLAEATLTAFQVQSVSGGETSEILRTMDSLVKNGLAPDFKTAGDLLVTGFQNGDDRGQDLLDTFNEYGSTFGQLRISGEGALGFINSGLSAGIDNSDRIADSIRETGIRLAEMGTDPNIANAFTQLDNMSDIDLAGALDAYEAGTMTGDQFFGAFFQALEDANQKDPTKAKNLAATLVGTISEDFGVEAVSQLTPTWSKSMGTLEGRAETAGNTISNTLGTSVDTLLRGVEQAATDFLSSDAIDLDAKIETLKGQITTALSTLSEGGTLGDAIEIGFGIGGVDDALGNIQRVFGQFVIALLEIIATIQDPLGVNDNDKGTRSEIARLATQQLPFDIKVANPDELDSIFGQAAKRGVTDLGGALNTAMEELIAEGNFDKANAILDEILSSPDVSPEAVAALTAKYQTMIDEAQKALVPPPIQGPSEGRGVKPNPFNNLGTLLPAGSSDGGMLGSLTSDIDNAVAKITDLDTTTATATDNVAASWDSLDVSLTENAATIVTTLDTTAAKVEELDQRSATALTENTVTASFDAVRESADENFPAVILYFDQLGDKIDYADAAAIAAAGSLAGLAAAVNEFPLAKLQSIVGIATGFAGAQNIVNNSGNNTTNNITVNNNPSNGAQSAADQYQLARMLG